MVWVWVQKGPGIRTAEIPSYWHVSLSPHCLSTLRNEEQWTHVSNPFSLSWKALVGEATITCEAWRDAKILMMFSKAFEILNKSQLLSLAGLWRENSCCTNWWFAKHQHHPCIYPMKQPISPKSLHECLFFFFFFPDIWKSTVLNGGVHFLSARRHNHLKSQGNITRTTSPVEQKTNQRPRAWNNHSGGTRQRDQK